MKKSTGAILVALLLLGFALRVHRIGEQRVWWDEGWSVWVARFPALDILRQTGNDVHPPLYFQLLHLWRLLSGDSEAGLRLLSAFLGVLAVAATFALGRSMARGLLPERAARLAGLLAALLLAVSRFAIAWSQEIRMYALATLLALLAVWAARRFWARGRAADAITYVLATTAGLYTLYLFAPVWAAINLAWLLTLGLGKQRRKEAEQPEETDHPRPPAPLLPRLLPWLLLQLASLALFLPWALYAAGGFLSTAAATPIRLLDFLHIYWTVLTVGIPVDVAQFNWLTLPALAVFLLAVGALIRELRTTNYERRMKKGASDPAANLPPDPVRAGISPAPLLPRSPAPPTPAPLRDLILLLAILLLPALLVYFISLPRQNFYNPPFNPRYLVIFTPFYSILLAWGLVALGRWLRDTKYEIRDASSEGSKLVSRISYLVSTLVTRRSSLVTLLFSAFMLAVALVGLWPYYPGRVRVDDYPSLVSSLAAFRLPTDSVVLYSDTDWPIFAYHHPQPWRGVPHLWTMTPELADEFLSPVWESHDGVWLVTTPYSATGDPQRHVPAWLAERAAAVRDFVYKDMALTFYARTVDRAATAGNLAPDAPPPRPLDVPLSDGAITGYAQATRDFVSGDTIHLFLYYTSPAGATAEVGLLGGDGQAWGAVLVDLPPATATARQQVDVVVPPDAPGGRYRFSVRGAGEPVTFGRLTIRQKDAALLTEADVSIPNRLDMAFAEGVVLLGYDLAGEARPGEALRLTLYWSSGGGVTQRYKVFTHLLGDTFNAGGGNFLWGQSDAEPAANTRPTTTWRAGEVIVDEHTIPIAPDAPSGTYRIEVGLYDPVTGARLTTLDGADHVIINTIEAIP